MNDKEIIEFMKWLSEYHPNIFFKYGDDDDNAAYGEILTLYKSKNDER